jgi:serine-type D-Ala-D-Ala carboxypeptidase/endopeptidase (penicillin-binding protein 4)
VPPGFSVVDEAGTPVYDFDADRALLPASTQKLPVAAAALARLGPDFRFRTEIAATGPMAGGVLDGDLVLVGGIDPALGTPAFAAHVNPKRPRTPLEALADQVARIGIAHISGDVLGDASVLPDEPVAPGWLDRYLRSGNTARSSGLTVDGGRRVFVEGGRWRSLPADDPAAQAAIALAELLLERGITIGGGAGAAPGSGAGAAVIGQVHSPPLIDLLRTTVQASDNHLADAIFRAVGRADGDGTWAGAARATSRALAPLGLAFEPAALADGSGLSRSDRLSAAALVELDRRVTASPAGAQWRSLMAVSGESGTLRRRLVGTVAQGRLLGKTGSLQDVRALSGAVEGPDGRRYHFAVIGNDLDEAGREAVRALQDAVVLALAEDLDGCRLVPAVPPVPAAPTDVGAPVDEGTPARLDCAA